MLQKYFVYVFLNYTLSLKEGGAEDSFLPPRLQDKLCIALQSPNIRSEGSAFRRRGASSPAIRL